MLKRAFRKVRYAILLASAGGPRVFFHQLKRQIYSTATFVGLEKNLDTDIVHVPSRLEYTLQLATEEDMEEVLQKAKSESKESAHELIQRVWFYESGFHNCYVARVGGELCHIQWLVSSKTDNVLSRGFGNRLPRLIEDEVLIENAFTFEKYRGNGVMPSVMTKLSEMARENGFRRMIAYVRQDNIASVKACEKAGFNKFEEIPELKLLSFTKRKYG